MAKPERKKTQRTPENPDQRSSKPTESEEIAQVQRAVLQFCVLMAATLFASMLDFPAQLATILAAGAAIVVGTRALIAVRNLRRKDGQTVILYVGIALCAVLGLGSLASLARIDVEMAYQSCKSEAVTEQAKLQCSIEYQEALTDYLKQLR